MAVEYIFPTAILVEDNVLTLDECNELSNFPFSIDFTKHQALEEDDISSYNTGQNVIDYIENNITSLSNLRSRLQARIDKYSEASAINSGSIDNSWLNIQNKGSLLKPHCHPGAQVSGALYVKAQDSLVFSSPNPYLAFNNYKRDNLKPNAFSHINVEVKPGRLILFPGWLIHQTFVPNQFDRRIVISFNTG